MSNVLKLLWYEIARSGPIIPYIIFYDNLLIFCKAYRKAARFVRQFLTIIAYRPIGQF